jgi:ribosomal protein S12
MDSRLARIELEEQIMKTTAYYVTATSRSADARAIVDRVNTVTAGNGDSANKKAVQAEMNEILNKIAAHGRMTAEEIVNLYGLKVEAEEFE